MDESNALLLEQARSGDNRALQLLLERHQARVYRFGLKMCRDPEDAKDVLQDTLIAMARGVREFRGSSSLSTWLYSVARSFCIKHRRKRPEPREDFALLGAESFAESASAEGALPDELASTKQLEQALERAIRGLDPAQREVLVLRDMEGLSAAEVAEVLQISVQAVKSRLHRARQALRVQLSPLLGLPSSGASSNCPDVVSLFSQYLEDELSAEVCQRMQLHLDGCSRCSQACHSLKNTLSLCRSAGHEHEVPAAVQHSVKRALADFLTRVPGDGFV